MYYFLRLRVPNAVSVMGVSDKHAFPRRRVNLLPLLLRHMNEDSAPKRSQLRYIWLFTLPQFIWSLIVTYRSRRTSLTASSMDRVRSTRVDRTRQILGYDTRRRYRIVSGTHSIKIRCDQCLVFDEQFKHFTFFLHQECHREMTAIVDKRHKIVYSTDTNGCYRSTNVRVDQFQHTRRTLLAALRKRFPRLFPSDARFTRQLSTFAPVNSSPVTIPPEIFSRLRGLRWPNRRCHSSSFFGISPHVNKESLVITQPR